MDEKILGNIPEPGESLFVFYADGIVAAVSAGHDRRLEACGENEMVKRGVRQHDADVSESRGDPWRKKPVGSFFEQDNGTGRTAQQGFLVVVYPCDLSGGLDIRRHDGKRLCLPEFSVPKPFDCHVAGRVDAQVKSSKPLDREDESLPDKADCLFQRVRVLEIMSCCITQAKPWSAGAAGIRLGMKAPVVYVFVFLPAVFAQLKSGHGRVAPVIGDVSDNGEPRAAVRAVYEGIAVPPVLRVEQFLEACAARGDIRGDMYCCGGVGPARQYPERWLTTGDDFLNPDTGQFSKRGEVLPDVRYEIIYGLPRSLYLCHNTVAPVLHKTIQTMAVCTGIDKGSEADPLYGPGKEDAETFRHETPCLNSSICMMIQLNQASSPQAVLQDTSNISRSGLMKQASFFALAMSKST